MGAVVDPELRQDVLNMGLDGLFGDEQRCRDITG